MRYVITTLRSEIHSLKLYLEDCKAKMAHFKGTDRERAIRKHYRSFRTKLLAYQAAIEILKEARKKKK
jgi:hypothetical protein